MCDIEMIALCSRYISRTSVYCRCVVVVVVVVVVVGLHRSRNVEDYRAVLVLGVCEVSPVTFVATFHGGHSREYTSRLTVTLTAR